MWIKVICWEVKIAISPFSAQHGTIIIPLRAILAGVWVHHMAENSSQCPVGVRLDGSLIATSKQHAPKCSGLK